MEETTSLLKSGQKLEIFHVNSKTSVSFKAFLEEFTDSYESEWNEESVFGRNDPHQTFKHIKRSINLSFGLPANDIEEAELNLQKVSALINMLYPDYNANAGKDFNSGTDSATAISASPFFKIKFMNLIQDVSKGDYANTGGSARVAGLPGVIKGTFDYSPDLEYGVFIDQKKQKAFPKVVSLSFTFSVLHSHKLGWQMGKTRQKGFPYNQDLTQKKETIDAIETFGEDSTSSGNKRTSQQNNAAKKKITNN